MQNKRPPFHRGITSRKLKTGVFALEGINSLATTYFFYDIYFYTKAHFNFGALQNLVLAAALGAVYAMSAYFGGRFAQRYGYFTAVRWGAGLMAVAFLVGSQVAGLAATLGAIIVGDVGMCLTWPALEALMSEGEPPARLQSLVGIYNVVWSGAGAFAYFTGGILMQWGAKNIFYVPAALLLVEVALAYWLEKEAQVSEVEPVSARSVPVEKPVRSEIVTPLERAMFLKMAWLANPLAYLAINTVIPTIPSLAAHFEFTPMQAGFVCSIWLFSRTGAFVLLRLWPEWHYRFRFLAGSFMAMIVSFGALLMVRDFWVLVISQAVFGIAIGLIYYSSLFYSMDVGETKGEHGGIHEAAIGAGNASGPALAAAALAFFPQNPGNGAAAVCGLLMVGLGGLFWMRVRPRRSAQEVRVQPL